MLYNTYILKVYYFILDLRAYSVLGALPTLVFVVACFLKGVSLIYLALFWVLIAHSILPFI